MDTTWKFGETLASIPAKFLREELQNDPRNVTLEQAKDLIEKKRRKPTTLRTKGRLASKAAKEKLHQRKRREEKEDEEEESDNDCEEDENQH